MKHLSKGRKLSRLRKQRRALLKTLLGSLIMKEKIKTTEAKAREIRPMIEKIITKAKKSSINNDKKIAVLRDLCSYLPKISVDKLVGGFANNFDDRNSGYVRIMKLDQRKSDGAKMAIIEFVDKKEKIVDKKDKE